MRVTVIATGFDERKTESKGIYSAAKTPTKTAPAAPAEPASNIDDIDEIFKIFNK